MTASFAFSSIARRLHCITSREKLEKSLSGKRRFYELKFLLHILRATYQQSHQCQHLDETNFSNYIHLLRIAAAVFPHSCVQCTEETRKVSISSCSVVMIFLCSGHRCRVVTGTRLHQHVVLGYALVVQE